MKEKGEHSVYTSESSADEYAADQLTGGIETASHEALHQIGKQGQKGLDATVDNVSRAKAKLQQKQAKNQQKEQPDAPAPDIPAQPAEPHTQESPQPLEHPKPAKQAAKSTDAPERIPTNRIKSRGNEITIRQAPKPAGPAAPQSTQRSVKTASRTVKTADTVSRTSIKTAQASAAATQKAAVAAERASQAALQSFRSAAKTAAETAKAAAKAVASAVKGIIAGTKALISAIAAGGWVAILVVVIVCLIGLIVGSCYGIFLFE